MKILNVYATPSGGQGSRSANQGMTIRSQRAQTQRPGRILAMQTARRAIMGAGRTRRTR